MIEITLNLATLTVKKRILIELAGWHIPEFAQCWWSNCDGLFMVQVSVGISSYQSRTPNSCKSLHSWTAPTDIPKNNPQPARLNVTFSTLHCIWHFITIVFCSCTVDQSVLYSTDVRYHRLWPLLIQYHIELLRTFLEVWKLPFSAALCM